MTDDQRSGAFPIRQPLYTVGEWLSDGVWICRPGKPQHPSGPFEILARLRATLPAEDGAWLLNQHGAEQYYKAWHLIPGLYETIKRETRGPRLQKALKANCPMPGSTMTNPEAVGNPDLTPEVTIVDCTWELIGPQGSMLFDGNLMWMFELGCGAPTVNPELVWMMGVDDHTLVGEVADEARVIIRSLKPTLQAPV